MIDGLIWIVDDSSLLDAKGPDLRPTLTEATQSIIDGFLRRDDLPGSLRVAVITYREGDSVGATEVGCRPVGCPGRLVTLAEWKHLAWPYQKAPRGKGAASCVPAFAQALAMIREAAQSPDRLDRVVVVHVTSIRQDDQFTIQGGLSDWQSLPHVGGASIFHLELAKGLVAGKPSSWYPTTDAQADSLARKWFWETATTLPDDWPRSDKNPDPAAARGVILRAKKSDFEQFVELLGQLLRQRAAAPASGATSTNKPVAASLRGISSSTPSEPPSSMSGQRPASAARVRWEYFPKHTVSRAPYGGPVCDSEGNVVVSSGAYLVAIDGRSGQVAWRHESPHGEWLASSPAPSPDGSFRVHGVDGMVSCLDGPSGVRWSAHVGPPNFYSTPIVDAHGNTYVAVSSGGLWRVDRDGAVSPFYATDDQFEIPPVVFNSTGTIVDACLFIGGDDHCLHAVNLETTATGTKSGAPIWDAWDKDQGRTNGYINTTISRAPSGELIAASSDDHLWAFQASGEAAWKVAVGGLVIASPVVDPSGITYLGVNRARGAGPRRGHLLQIDPRRRAERRIVWARELVAAIESTPVIGADGTVYAADRDGNVFAFHPNGDLAWTERLNAPVESALKLTNEGLLIVSTHGGAIYALDCSSHGMSRTA